MTSVEGNGCAAHCASGGEASRNVTKCVARRLEPRLWGNLHAEQLVAIREMTMVFATLRRFSRHCIATAATLVALMVVIGGCAGLEMKERELLFRPTREAAGWYGGMPESVQEIYLPVGASAPGERIHAWWWPADDPRAPVVYYLHGVRWNLTGQLNRISQLRRFGFAVFAIDYRGFGKSDGEMPSEATVYEDARVGWKWLIAREPDPARRYIYGHSLGGAVAIDLAAEVSGDPVGARGLIVESTFTSLPELVSEMGYGWLPCCRRNSTRSARSDRSGCRCCSCTARRIATCRRV